MFNRSSFMLVAYFCEQPGESDDELSLVQGKVSLLFIVKKNLKDLHRDYKSSQPVTFSETLGFCCILDDTACRQDGLTSSH